MFFFSQSEDVTGPAGVSRCLTLWSVVGDDGHRLPGVLQGGGSLLVGGVAEVHPVHLKDTVKNTSSVLMLRTDVVFSFVTLHRRQHDSTRFSRFYTSRGVESARQIYPKLPAVYRRLHPLSVPLFNSAVTLH